MWDRVAVAAPERAVCAGGATARPAHRGSPAASHRRHTGAAPPLTRPTFPVFAHLILQPTGPILIDTGVGIGNAFIDDLYSPQHHDLDHALRANGVTTNDIETVISSHLHFDHCGQNHRFSHAAVIVQHAEVEAAKAPFYTVAEWAFPPDV